LKLALAYHAYALESPVQCLSYLDQVRDLANAQAHLNAMGSLRSSASSVQTRSVSENTSSVSFIGSFVSSEPTSVIADVADGRAWVAIEVIRSVCLQGELHPSLCCHLLSSRCVTGMSLEKLPPTDNSTILSAYLNATQALSTIEGSFSLSIPPNSLHSPSSGTVHVINPSFTRYRELWRWVERLLRRAIIAASRVCSLNGEQESILWTLFSQYQTYSTHWPQTFRAKHRSTVAVLFIRALVSRARLIEHLPFILHAHFPPANSDVPVTASTVARRAIQDYRDILNSSTRFPKAGERNIKVEELTDLCVAVWEAGGSKSSDAAWVMDVSVLPKDGGCRVTFR
jgi:hypothetical protein